MFCDQCGYNNVGGSRFCSSCGTGLGEPRGPDETTTLSPLATVDHADIDVPVPVIIGTPGSSGVLVVKRGPNAGSKFVLEGAPVNAGRSPDSDIFLDDVTVSRHHAEFVPREGGGYDVRDAGSLNGTYLNRERIDNAPLANGDEVQIGKFKLVFLAGAAG